MDDLRKRFGQLVAAHRRRKGLTREELAGAAELSVDMIAKIENGSTGARFPVIERLAGALDVDPCELFFVPGAIGSNRRLPLTEVGERLALLSDADLRWVREVLEVVLKPRAGTTRN